jgi:RNA recognition motif-containing protein
MSNLIFVSNLPHDATESQIRDHFSPIGRVVSVLLKVDRKGRSRCFCFVDMENAEEAISSNDGKELGGRKLRVHKAHELEVPRPHFTRRFRR